MMIFDRRTAVLGFFSAGLATSLALPLPAVAADEDPWPSLKAEIFGDRPVSDAPAGLTLYAPEAAEDAAVVPVSIRFAPDAANRVKKVTLIIDRNPAPVEATFTFGDGFKAEPSIGERQIATRVRVDSYSKIRAVAEMADGSLVMAARFVMGAGGCSSPMSKDMEAAMASLGRMQVKVKGEAALGDAWREGVVMIRHPNFTGMQKDVTSGGYTPAHFVRDIEVKKAGQLVFRMEGGISISEDPNFRFNYSAAGGEALEAIAVDTHGGTFSAKSLPAGT